MSGLVQEFTLEADTTSQLKAALAILMAWHKQVSHYITGTDVEGRPFLSLLWHGSPKGALPLIAPMNTPDAIASQVDAWLKTAEYGRQPDHDGDNHRGYRLTKRGPKLYSEEWRSCDWEFYSVFTVYPCWVEYGK